MTTLHDRLGDLAEDAPPGGTDPDLWERGVRRHRRQRIVAVAAVAAAVALIGGAGATVRLQADPPPTPPVDVPFGDLHVPRHVYPPSPWAEGTDELGPPGPLAAVSVGERNVREGLTGKRTVAAYYGVSAVDGSVRFLDVPGAGGTIPILTAEAALSPDGTKVGYLRGSKDGTTLGWAVYDTITGSVVQLSDPQVPEIPELPTGFDLSFSGDSRYLQTDYARSPWGDVRDSELVVWDVSSGKRYTAEGPGHRWLPVMGSAPEGIMWSRGSDIFSFDPVTGATSHREAPEYVVHASLGPDGQLAYIGRASLKADWVLHAGGQALDLQSDDFYLISIAGWRDADHLVVNGAQGQQSRIVDLRTGTAESTGTAGPFDGVFFAADLWANDLVDGVRPPKADDPRPTSAEIALVVAAGVALLLVAGGGGWFLWRRRVRP